MRLIALVLCLYSTISWSAEAEYANRKVIIRDKILVNGTDFRVDMTVSDIQRQILMKEVFRHRALGYLSTTRVQDSQKAIDKISSRIEEFHDISMELRKRTPKIAYTKATMPVVLPISGVGGTPVHTADIVSTTAIFQKIDDQLQAKRNGDYPTALRLYYEISDERPSLEGILSEPQRKELDRKFSDIDPFLVAGILNIGPGVNLKLMQPTSGSRDIFLRLMNSALAADACSGSRTFYKLLVVYVLDKSSLPMLYLKNKGDLFTCSMSKMDAALTDQIANIELIKKAQNSADAIKGEMEKLLLDILRSEVRSPSEDLQKHFIDMIN